MGSSRGNHNVQIQISVGIENCACLTMLGHLTSGHPNCCMGGFSLGIFCERVVFWLDLSFFL